MAGLFMDGNGMVRKRKADVFAVQRSKEERGPPTCASTCVTGSINHPHASSQTANQPTNQVNIEDLARYNGCKFVSCVYVTL